MSLEHLAPGPWVILVTSFTGNDRTLDTKTLGREVQLLPLMKLHFEQLEGAAKS